MSEITFRHFKEEDIEPCTFIMKEAFDEDSMLFREVPDGTPGYDDGSFLKMNAVDSPGCKGMAYRNTTLFQTQS